MVIHGQDMALLSEPMDLSHSAEIKAALSGLAIGYTNAQREAKNTIVETSALVNDLKRAFVSSSRARMSPASYLSLNLVKESGIENSMLTEESDHAAQLIDFIDRVLTACHQESPERKGAIKTALLALGQMPVNAPFVMLAPALNPPDEPDNVNAKPYLSHWGVDLNVVNGKFKGLEVQTHFVIDRLLITDNGYLSDSSEKSVEERSHFGEGSMVAQVTFPNETAQVAELTFSHLSLQTTSTLADKTDLHNKPYAQKAIADLRQVLMTEAASDTFSIRSGIGSSSFAASASPVPTWPDSDAASALSSDDELDAPPSLRRIGSLPNKVNQLGNAQEALPILLKSEVVRTARSQFREQYADRVKAQETQVAQLAKDLRRLKAKMNFYTEAHEADDWVRTPIHIRFENKSEQEQEAALKEGLQSILGDDPVLQAHCMGWGQDVGTAGVLILQGALVEQMGEAYAKNISCLNNEELESNLIFRKTNEGMEVAFESTILIRQIMLVDKDGGYNLFPEEITPETPPVATVSSRGVLEKTDAGAYQPTFTRIEIKMDSNIKRELEQIKNSEMVLEKPAKKTILSRLTPDRALRKAHSSGALAAGANFTESSQGNTTKKLFKKLGMKRYELDAGRRAVTSASSPNSDPLPALK